MTSDLLRELSESRLSVVVYALACTIIVVVGFLLLFPGALATGVISYQYAPVLHAYINASCAVLLIAGYIAIRMRKIRLHRALMLTAFSLSCCFLVSYVVYHSQQTEPVRFAATGLPRLVYYVILVSHIILAMVILPMALFTITRSWRGEFSKHRAIARITLPLWLYVALSGVVVYLMLYVWYPA